MDKKKRDDSRYIREGFENTFDDIAIELNVSRERAIQIANGAYKKFRRKLEKMGIDINDIL